MEILIFGTPLVILMACLVAAGWLQRNYVSTRTTRLGRIVDHIGYFALNVMSGLLLYNPIAFYLGLPPDLHAPIAFLITLTIENVATGLGQYLKSSDFGDTLRQIIMTLITKKPRD
ncbi:hypothetical protein [Cereibacter changlensis]|uniref:hypothetical protein n=1 Tax=Cereibacter changlensis TaxID=402884 RepID=UPI0040335FD7